MEEDDINILNELSQGNNAGDMDGVGNISQRLQKLMLRMKGEYMNEDGKGVDYLALSASSLYVEYKQMAELLTQVDLSCFERKQRMAFIINIYNSLTIHGLIESLRLYSQNTDCQTVTLPTSVLNLKRFWSVTAYRIGAYTYTLDQLEHVLLRGNKPHPTSTKPLLPAGDSRLEYVINPPDPRIHFALVCAAKSCPSINVYTAENIDRALEAATENFCRNEIQVLTRIRQISMNKIFLWYRTDFDSDDVGVVRWCLPYVSSDIRDNVIHLLDLLEKKGGVSITYRDYNWSLNSLNPIPPSIAAL